jgi:hypothetical protein
MVGKHLRRRWLLGLVASIVPVAALTMAAPALATVHHPKGEYAVFADCPLSNPEVTLCTVATTESGEFTIGKETVPITNTITLQGGLNTFLTGTETFYGAEDGNTLSKSPQKVPGGLAGLVKCNEITEFLERIACELVFENKVTGVTATTEQAGSIGVNTLALATGSGSALTLPVKLHLENPLLGGSCYIGSNAHPIVIEFTTGTTSPPGPNKPITGKPGELSANETGTIITDTGNELVNNSYPAPAAEGCGGVFSFLIDPILDAKLGLPSAAGNNTAILRGKLKLGEAAAVKASE